MIYYSYLGDTLSSDGAAVWSATFFYTIGGLIALLLMGLGGRLFCALCKGTPERFGVSFSPLKSFSVSSLLGFLSFPVFGVGWTKASLYDPENRGKSFLISVGGPIFCLLCGLIFTLLYALITGIALVGSLLLGIATACVAFSLFSLLPLPGLWGGTALAALLPEKTAEKWVALRKYAPFFITLALLLTVRSGVHTTVIQTVINAFGSIIS